MSIHAPTPCFEPLRTSAKELLRAFRADDPLARKRMMQHLRHKIARSMRAGAPRVTLADALHVVAREAGYRSWPALLAQAGEGTNLHAPLGGRNWRASFVEGLVEQIAALARDRDVEATIDRMSALGRRHGDVIRARLAERGDLSAVVDLLIVALGHPSARLRFESAGLLDHFADARRVTPLRALLHDPVPRVRRAALHSLGCERCKSSPLPSNGDFLALAIDQALNDESIVVRRHAVSELSVRLADPRAAEVLTVLLERESDETIRRTIQRALHPYKGNG